MFQWNGDDQEEKLVEEEVFPLRKIADPVREKVFRNMKIDTLIKMSFESLSAAEDIQKAHFRPKTMEITVGDLIERKIEFKLDEFTCIVGTKIALRGKKEDYTFFSARTVSGESLEEVTTKDNCMYIIVPQEEDLLEAVKIFYSHLCFVFEEAVTTNLVVLGAFAYLYPVICSIRSINKVDQLEICGDWAEDEDQTNVFDQIMERTTYNYLALHGNMPEDSKPVNIVAERVYFNMKWQFWLTEKRWDKVDAKNIIMRNIASPLTTLAERFNHALKCFANGTGFNRLESMKFINMNPSQIEILKANLPLTDWVSCRRPGYYCAYKTEGDKKIFSGFYDLREAKDVKGPNSLGTIIEMEDSVLFLKWTPKELQELKMAPGLILEKKEKHTNNLNNVTAYINSLERCINVADVAALREEIRRINARLEEVTEEILEGDPPDPMVLMREVKNLQHELLRARQAEDRVNHVASEKRARDRISEEIQKCDGYLKLIEDHPF